jgi:multidrug efflux pump subunit AcrB
VRLRLPNTFRADPSSMAAIQMRGRDGSAIPLGELVRFEHLKAEQPIQRKDRERVQYVTAESLGYAPVEAVFRTRSTLEAALPPGMRIDWSGDGDWQVTFDSLRDLGRAFGLSLLTIFVLLVAQTGSLGLPLIIMLAIPLTLIGVLPGFWLLNLLFSTHVNGVLDPVFLSGPVLMGLIALSGIVVRNSIILLDFIAVLSGRGVPLHDAIIEAVVTRLRPILLTAGASVLGAWIIVLDPIFSGLAWTIVFGLIASTTLTLGVVPVVYARLWGKSVS